MDRDTAIELFDAIEGRSYDSGPEPREIGAAMVEAPCFNVRLDAGTDTESNQRFYKLFVRIDRMVPLGNGARLVAWVMELARAHGARATLENAGIELS